MKATKLTPEELKLARKNIPKRHNEPSAETLEIRKALEDIITNSPNTGIYFDIKAEWKKTLPKKDSNGKMVSGSFYNKEFSKLQSQVQYHNQKTEKGRFIMYLSENRKIAYIEFIDKEVVDKYSKLGPKAKEELKKAQNKLDAGTITKNEFDSISEKIKPRFDITEYRRSKA
jgi:hypothetical protein